MMRQAMIIFQITCNWIQTSIVTIPAYVKTFQYPISGDQPLNPVSFTRALTNGIIYLRIWSRKRIKPISIIFWGNASLLNTEYLNTFYRYITYLILRYRFTGYGTGFSVLNIWKCVLLVRYLFLFISWFAGCDIC